MHERMLNRSQDESLHKDMGLFSPRPVREFTTVCFVWNPPLLYSQIFGHRQIFPQPNGSQAPSPLLIRQSPHIFVKPTWYVTLSPLLPSQKPSPQGQPTPKQSPSKTIADSGSMSGQCCFFSQLEEGKARSGRVFLCKARLRTTHT